MAALVAALPRIIIDLLIFTLIHAQLVWPRMWHRLCGLSADSVADRLIGFWYFIASEAPLVNTRSAYL